MVCDSTQVPLLLGRDEGAFNTPWDLCPPNTTWEKLLGLDWRGQAEGGRHSTTRNAAALQAQPSGSSPLVSECVGGQAEAQVPTAAGTQSRHQPDCRAGTLYRQRFPGKWLSPLVLGVHSLPPGAGLSFR